MLFVFTIDWENVGPKCVDNIYIYIYMYEYIYIYTTTCTLLLVWMKVFWEDGDNHNGRFVDKLYLLQVVESGY